MPLEGRFLREAQAHVSELTDSADVRILDAATGAGGTTTQIASAMRGGRLLTMDIDPESWDLWARPRLEIAGLADRVEFVRGDLRDIDLADGSVDLVVSDATISCLGLYAVDALEEFRRVLKPGGRLALRDLLPESESEPHDGNVAALSWRVMKAAAHLAGREHYEEPPATWVRKRLGKCGFDVASFEVVPARRPVPEPARQEWAGIDWSDGVTDPTLRSAVRRVRRELVARAETEGLTTKTGCYACWAR